MAVALVNIVKKMDFFMEGFFNKLLGVHPQALYLQGARAELLSANLTNADTPNYKAQDIDFISVLKNQMDDLQPVDDVSLDVRSDMHIDTGSLPHSTLYRTPTQASLDGNTVETHIEKANFMENALRYQVSTQLVSGKLNGIIKVLKGE